MNLRENLSRSREVLAAYWRHGLHELGSVFYGPNTAAQHPEYGMIGTKPPGLVSAGLEPDKDAAPSRDDPAPSIIDERVKQAEQQRDVEREPEPPQQERE
ncbi:MAG: hypothetical protein GC200_12555 [Tepidisphaera sp.]|nr:MAG: hypothetical protein EDM82_08415 [Cyanobacteria bacterium CYA]MBI1191498.1 hypothetical protein [Tepidisphaera sp.]